MLPTARTIYLLIACVSLAAAIGALLVALVSQMQSWRTADLVPVPQAGQAPLPPVNLSTVSARMIPPRAIRFIITQGFFSHEINTGQVLGYFTADTANGLPNYPDDFSIIGGKDTDLFHRVSMYAGGGHLRTGLAPTQKLVDQVNSDQANFTERRINTFSLRIVAHDSYGNVSSGDVTFAFTTGPTPAEVQLPMPVAPVKNATDLQKLAGEIANKADPSHGATFFDVYERAQRVPRNCGAQADDPVFLNQYRKAFNGIKDQLTSSNAEAFFAGMCDAWRQAQAQRSADEARAELAKNNAESRNQEAILRNQFAKAEAKTARNAAVGFAGAAIGAFIVICLFLAFLAMENHTKAVREAIEALARERDPARTAQ